MHNDTINTTDDNFEWTLMFGFTTALPCNNAMSLKEKIID